jgi:hypothetical protein
MNSISMQHFMIVTSMNNHNDRLKEPEEKLCFSTATLSKNF